MTSIIDVAGYIEDWYFRKYGVTIDEIRLHKLLYFVQKENYKLFGVPAFEEDFVGWVHGPVSLDVRYHFKEIKRTNHCEDPMLREALMNVYEKYGEYSIDELIDETHNEVPWVNSRRNFFKNEVGNTVILKSDIREEAMKLESFDELWGMEYSEHEDYEE